ncbi:helix-turn-helix domain-containing protein [Streptomyces sp. NL15-2K]|uniref:helix-turn-helix domain-containing protein n=1 Tax=Streptomyces sp. NL15-2K TaxID=376149 RepID=UPI0035B51297
MVVAAVGRLYEVSARVRADRGAAGVSGAHSVACAELFAAGHGNAAVAKDLRVSVRSVQRWRRAWEQGGERAWHRRGQCPGPS